MRAIGLSPTACKDEFRRNLRSHSWSSSSLVPVINIKKRKQQSGISSTTTEEAGNRMFLIEAIRQRSIVELQSVTLFPCCDVIGGEPLTNTQNESVLYMTFRL